MQLLQNPPLCGSTPSALPENVAPPVSKQSGGNGATHLHLAFLALSHSSLSVAGKSPWGWEHCQVSFILQ
jgi:hypothetical protein